MQTLYPIIRRVRRPLLVVDAPPVMVGNVEPVQPVLERLEAPTVVKAEAVKASDEKVSGKRHAR